MTFLSSFKSEFRTFYRVPNKRSVNEIGEKVPDKFLKRAFTGVLLKNAADREGNHDTIGYISESYKLYIEIATELQKQDQVLDEEREYEVVSVDVVYAFWGKKDHKLAILKRNK